LTPAVGPVILNTMMLSSCGPLGMVGLVCLLAACARPSTEPDPAPAESTDVARGPINIAHRGASAYAPEHTLAGYALAIEMGADYVEQDLQLTRDGVLICMHDTTLDRTTNVAELFPDRATEVEVRGNRRPVWRVSDFTLEEIKTLDAGAWFDEAFAGTRVPTFQEAIDLVKGQAGIYPETKAPEEYEALGLTMEEELVRVLAANGLDTPEAQRTTPIYVQSFSPASLRQVYALTGDTYALVQLVSGGQAETLMTDDGLREVAQYADGIGPAVQLIADDPSRSAMARELGLEIHPYTVRASRLPDGFSDAGVYMRHLFDDLGATGVFTDNPDLFPR
jgi:glycerophosphoryl diester phosphodiesterase